MAVIASHPFRSPAWLRRLVPWTLFFSLNSLQLVLMFSSILKMFWQGYTKERLLNLSMMSVWIQREMTPRSFVNVGPSPCLSIGLNRTTIEEKNKKKKWPTQYRTYLLKWLYIKTRYKIISREYSGKKFFHSFVY